MEDRFPEIITGVPENDWTLELPDGVCIDIVPLAKKHWAVRPYGFDDVSKGDIRVKRLCIWGFPSLIGWRSVD